MINCVPEPERENYILKSPDACEQQSSSDPKVETNSDPERRCADFIGNSPTDSSTKFEIVEDNDDDFLNGEKEMIGNNDLYWSETWPLTISKSQELKISPSLYNSEANHNGEGLVLPDISVRLKGEKKCERDRNYNTCDDVSSHHEPTTYNRCDGVSSHHEPTTYNRCSIIYKRRTCKTSRKHKILISVERKKY